MYFLPGVPGANPGMLAARGLASRFSDSDGPYVVHSVTAASNGPCGGGCIVASGENGAFYAPDRQRWVEGDGFWVGMEIAPRPSDLEREVGLKGHSINLANMDWRIPLLKFWDDATMLHKSNLPKSFRSIYKDNKKSSSLGVAPGYEHLDVMADEIFLRFVNNESISIDDAVSECVKILSINYRIESEECELLGILNDESVVKILGMAIDLPRIQAIADAFAIDGLQAREPIIEQED